jgi:hypothetical protein
MNARQMLRPRAISKHPCMVEMTINKQADLEDLGHRPWVVSR